MDRNLSCSAGTYQIESMYRLAGCRHVDLLIDLCTISLSGFSQTIIYSQQHWTLYSAGREVSSPKEYNSAVEVIPSFTLNVWIGESVLFFFNSTCWFNEKKKRNSLPELFGSFQFVFNLLSAITYILKKKHNIWNCLFRTICNNRKA